MNLVGGIMIDGFASLRESDDARDEDKKGQCYICSKTKANVMIILIVDVKRGLNIYQAYKSSFSLELYLLRENTLRERLN